MMGYYDMVRDVYKEKPQPQPLEQLPTVQPFNADAGMTLEQLQFNCNHPGWEEQGRDYIHNNFLGVALQCTRCGIELKTQLARLTP